MFPDIGGTELIIVAIVTLLVVKPKDIPVMMRKIGQFMGKARRLATDFRSSFEDMARQSELDDLRKEVEAMRTRTSEVMADPIGFSDGLSDTVNEINQALSDTPDTAAVQPPTKPKKPRSVKAASSKAVAPKATPPRTAKAKPASSAKTGKTTAPKAKTS